MTDKTMSTATPKRVFTYAPGRPWTSADTVKVYHYEDCHRVEVCWDDGLYTYVLHDTREEAMEHVRSLGFEPVAKQPAAA